MGLLNLPGPLLGWVDQGLASFLPPLVRLVLWSALASVLAMELYRLLSPQKRITAIKRDFQTAQHRLNTYDGPFEGARPLIGRVLGLAFRRVGLVLPATLAASLPLLMMIVWLDASYAYRFPEPRESVGGGVPAPGFAGRWEPSGGESAQPRAVVTDGNGEVVAEVALEAPIPLIHKWRAWNLLLGNPAGYLPGDAPVDRLTLALPRLEVQPFGPAWLRGWEPSFFLALVVFALLLKTVRRIE